MSTEELKFKSVDERDEALRAMPDEPPQGVNIDEWQEEQDRKVNEIMSAPISTNVDGESTTDEVVNNEEENVNDQNISGSNDDDLIDFTDLGKIKRSDLPENLRQYANPREILKQADHARRYANDAEGRIAAYEAKIAELESASKIVPDLKKQMEDLQKKVDTTEKEISVDTFIKKKDRKNINDRLNSITAKLNGLKEYGDDNEVLQTTISGVVDTLNDTFNELDEVRNEVSRYQNSDRDRIKELERRIESVADISKQDAERRRMEFEQKKAEMSLNLLQENHPELKTTLPLYSDDKKDLESAIVRMTQKVFGRPIKSFDEVNRFVGAFNSKDPELKKLCEREGINPADYGISGNDIRNYGILMNVHWQQQGERIDPNTGKRTAVTDFRGNKVIFPDYESTFQHMKNTSGLSRAEQELAIIEAEKKGQESLNSSLQQRDVSSKILEPTGAPPEGPNMSETEAKEVLGMTISNRTVDEEVMEMLLRNGDKRGWAMFNKINKARETLSIPVLSAEPHWQQVT